MLGDKPAMPAWTCFYQRLLARDEREASEVLEKAMAGRPMEEAYDEVLVPTLILAEEDRKNDELEDSAERFIRDTTRELIEEMAYRESGEDDREEEAAWERRRYGGCA